MMGAKLTDARASGGYPAEAISNRRSRKCFGFRTPNRLFFPDLSACCVWYLKPRAIKAYLSEIIAGFALLLSGYATWQAISFNKKQESLVETQEKLNNLLLEKEEVQVLSDKQADLGASFIKLGRSKYRLKIWNKGNACARNVRLNFPEGNNILIQSEIDEKFPLECLEKFQSVELIAAVDMQTNSKHTICLVWEDDAKEHNQKLVYPTL